MYLDIFRPQVISLWDASLANGSLSSNGTVNNPDTVANAAAEVLGYGGLNFSFGWEGRSRSGRNRK